MSSTETQRNEEQQEEKEEENNNAVLPQIGEDPGVPVEAIEEDSKQRPDKDRHKQEKDGDLTDSKA